MKKIRIVRWTTPTIKYTFKSQVPVSTISKAYLTAKVRGVVMFQKDITSATVNSTTNTISWMLAQSDTGALPYKQQGELFLDWYLSSGTRGAGEQAEFITADSGKNEVIS